MSVSFFSHHFPWIISAKWTMTSKKLEVFKNLTQILKVMILRSNVSILFLQQNPLRTDIEPNSSPKCFLMIRCCLVNMFSRVALS